MLKSADKTHIRTAIPPTLESLITSGDSLPKTVEQVNGYYLSKTSMCSLPKSFATSGFSPNE
jgi:hypothetical protein